MTTWTESDGSGLPDQLHALALKASIDGAWNDAVPQGIELSRVAAFPVDTSVSVTVSFEARKSFNKPDDDEESILETRFVVTATEIHDQLYESDLPEIAINGMYRPSVDSDDALSSEAIGGDDLVDQLTDDFDEEVTFRRQRVVQYHLSHAAELLFSQRSEKYYSIEDDEESEIFYVSDVREGTVENQMQNVLDLSVWPDGSKNRKSIHQIPHPDLLKLDYAIEKDELRNDVAFLEIVRKFVSSGELQTDARIEHEMAVKSILAFLNFEGSYYEVQKLI